ncbi:MAG: AraC family transcriptional regulator [Verrucomicrobiota bacterium]
MPDDVPHYQFRDQVLEADRCLSLVGAIDGGAVEFGGLARGGYPGSPLGRELPGLRSVGFWNAGRESAWALEEHRNEGIEIAFLESGSLPFLIHDEWHEMQPGDLTVTRPWQPHGLGQGSIPACKLSWFIIDVGVRMPNQDWRWPDWIVLTQKDLATLSTLLRGNEVPIRQSNRMIAATFTQLRQLLEGDDQPGRVSAVAVMINTILLGLIELLENEPAPRDENLSSSRRAVEIFLRELETHLAFMQRDWTLEEMAAECSVGRTVFTEHCREIVNLTPFDYLNRCRLKWAKREIGERVGKPITEIAMEAGYSSSAYFGKLFKQREGVSPSAYRKSRL